MTISDYGHTELGAGSYRIQRPACLASRMRNSSLIEPDGRISLVFDFIHHGSLVTVGRVVRAGLMPYRTSLTSRK